MTIVVGLIPHAMVIAGLWLAFGARTAGVALLAFGLLEFFRLGREVARKAKP